jgi:hypothetical protein
VLIRPIDQWEKRLESGPWLKSGWLIGGVPVIYDANVAPGQVYVGNLKDTQTKPVKIYNHPDTPGEPWPWVKDDGEKHKS